MRQKITVIFVCFFIFLLGSANGQESSTPVNKLEAKSTLTSATETETEVVTGEVSAAVGVSRELFDDWNLICTATVSEKPTRSCHISTRFQVAKETAGNGVSGTDPKNAKQVELAETVLLFSILSKPKQSQEVGIFSLPLGIYLPTGLTVQVDKRKPFGVPIETCNPTGCHAGLKLTKNRMVEFKRGNTAFVYFQDGNQNTLKLPLSLKGFTKAIGALSERIKLK